MRDQRRHTVILQDWLLEYEPYALGYKLLFTIHKLELIGNDHNWPGKDESLEKGDLSMTRDPSSVSTLV
jgi:hypothetical protein